MLPLLDTLAAGLERPREITAQVSKHLNDVHGVARDEMGRFLDTHLPQLEDYEIELIFAPLFTPTLSDQAGVAELLGPHAVPPPEWPGLVRQLVARPTCARLRTADGTIHSPPLRDVVVERFVYRLRLDGTIAPEVFQLLDRRPQTPERALLQAVARRAIWENPARREILARYLGAAGAAAPTEDAVALLKLVETYEPAGVAGLLAQIPHWQQVLRQEINEAGAKPFFNERVADLHGGGRDQRRQDTVRLAAQERELAFLERLQRIKFAS